MGNHTFSISFLEKLIFLKNFLKNFLKIFLTKKVWIKIRYVLASKKKRILMKKKIIFMKKKTHQLSLIFLYKLINIKKRNIAAFLFIIIGFLNYTHQSVKIVLKCFYFLVRHSYKISNPRVFLISTKLSYFYWYSRTN